MVQIEDVQTREAHFHDQYTYFSSYSTTWLRHAEKYAEMMCARFSLDASKVVAEIASNDGYLLRYFKARGVPVFGVDPAINCARVAHENYGIETITRFFGVELAQELAALGRHADLITANNVLAHVPDLNDFVEGLKILLKRGGVITIEFPHLLKMIEANYFDTIYHEHYSYLSLLSINRLFARHELEIFDLEELPTHGGSLRVFVGHKGVHSIEQAHVENFQARESAAGLDAMSVYLEFAEHVRSTKRHLLELLIGIKGNGGRIAGYGAPAKGNTLLNYCGVRGDILDFTVDANPHKQGLLLPGTGIPVYSPAHVAKVQPDYLLILPWNLKDEILQQMAHIRSWGARFILPLPVPTIID